MINITIKGIITHFFDDKYQHPKYSASFLKKNILIESEGESYTISFVKDRIEFLKYCKLGTEVEVNVRLKGRNWNFKNKEYSVNELTCNSLKIIRNTKFDDFIYHNGNEYVPIKSYADGNLILNLKSTSDQTEMILSINLSFPDKRINENHIFLWDQTDDELIEQLYQKGILEKGFWKKVDIFGGYVCKVLILDLFKENNILYPIKNQTKKSNYTDFSETSSINYSGFVDETDYTHFDENLDMDQQSDEFWNQF
jgi:hypothetical protein